MDTLCCWLFFFFFCWWNYLGQSPLWYFFLLESACFYLFTGQASCRLIPLGTQEKSWKCPDPLKTKTATRRNEEESKNKTRCVFGWIVHPATSDGHNPPYRRTHKRRSEEANAQREVHHRRVCSIWLRLERRLAQMWHLMLPTLIPKNKGHLARCSVPWQSRASGGENDHLK